jgi:hypothetical protein
MKQLARQSAKLLTAAIGMKSEMLRLHPVGSQVRVYLSCSQVEPSLAVVTGASGFFETYSVRLVKNNPRGLHTTKKVHWSRVE